MTVVFDLTWRLLVIQGLACNSIPFYSEDIRLPLSIMYIEGPFYQRIVLDDLLRIRDGQLLKGVFIKRW